MESDNTSTLQKWQYQIKKTGARLTTPRRAILQVIIESCQPLTPIEIFDRARTYSSSLGLVTVYRTIDILEKLELIDRVHGHGQCQTIIRGSESHQHLLTCTSCGSSIYFDGLDVESQFHRIGEEKGFAVNGHWLQLYGLCTPCQKKEI